MTRLGSKIATYVVTANGMMLTYAVTPLRHGFQLPCTCTVIERAIDKLSRRHGVHINEYDANNGVDNAHRLTGHLGIPHIRNFTAGVTNRNCFVRIPRQVSDDKRGYLETRRSAANADPYQVISEMLWTCVFDE